MPLSEAQLSQFDRDGFLIVEDFFPDDVLAPVIAEIDDIVDDLARRLHRAGKIRGLHEDEGFTTRLTRLEEEFAGAATLVHIRGILGPAMARLWTDRRLLDVIEQLLGPEIAGHPVWNLRSKTPVNPLATVPWHQDTAYLAEGAETTFQPTAWIPLVDATGENGTLQVIRGAHRGAVCRHALENKSGHPRSWYLVIPPEELPAGEVVTCEMRKGSFLLFNQLLPHRSTENLSRTIRWSVDLRWQRPGESSGFEGIKDCILMRSAQPGFRLSWGDWVAENRIAAGMVAAAGQGSRDEFDATVSGPWMLRWS